MAPASLIQQFYDKQDCGSYPVGLPRELPAAQVDHSVPMGVNQETIREKGTGHKHIVVSPVAGG